MRRESVFSSIALFVLAVIASVHSQSQPEPEPRLDDAANLRSNLDGLTITITPSSSYEVYCYTPGIAKNWYKINGDSAASVLRNSESGYDPNVYASKAESGSVALHFESFRTNDIGEYECRYTKRRLVSTLSIYLTTPSLAPTPTPSPTPTPTPMPPSKVQGVTVTRTSQGSYPSVTVSLSVSWSAVSGSGITYTVCYSTTSGTHSDPPSGADCSASGITGTSTTLGPLSRGTTYYIWVAAASSDGPGPYSDREQETTYQVPSQVGPPVLTKAVSSGRPALRVTWTAPSSERPITKYQVQYRIGDASWSTEDVTSTSTTLENLSAGTSYQVQVRAVSDVGDGPYSVITASTTYQVPSQVGAPVLTKTASSGSSALIVTWTALTGEHPNIRYQVQYRISGSTSWSIKNVTSTSTTLENLFNGTSYQVRVRAVSDVGSGPYSPIRTNTTYRVPEQVTGVEVTVNNTNNVLTITWDRPSSELPITNYFVSFDEIQHLTRVVGATTLTITGTPGRTYMFRVIAESAVGFGEWSEIVTTEIPSQPVINVTAHSTTTLTVRWDDEGFSYTLHVQKKRSTEINTFGPVTLPYNITGLESNTEYTVVVEAYNPLGSANRSVVGYTLPEVPGDLVPEVLSSTSIRVTWTPPPNAERLPLTYHVGYSSEFTAEMSNSTTELSLVLTGLHPFDMYTVTVEAENTGGRGGPTTKEARTLSDVPSLAPRSPTTREVRSRSALLHWSIPLRIGRNGIIIQYKVDLSIYKESEYRNLRNITVPVEDPSFDEPSTITYNVTDLTPFNYYYFQVAAVNDAGVGPFGHPSTPFATEQDFPGPVSNLSYQIMSDTSAKIMWSEPEEPNGVMHGYDVTFGDYGDYSGHTMESVTSTMKELIDLSPETPINVTVQAKNTVGLGKPNSITLFTKEGVPRVAPKNVTVVRINSTAISVSWIPLTLHEARGWPVYVVYLWGSSQLSACELQSVNTSGSSVVIGNLDSASYYSVVVQVSTAAGTSEELKSQPVNDIKKNGLDADSDASSDGLSAGLFIAGLFSGVIAVLLVEGIICGVWKISKMSQKKNIEGDYSDPTNMQMTECPAYESIDREGKGAERVYEEIGSRDTKGKN